MTKATKFILLLCLLLWGQPFRLPPPLQAAPVKIEHSEDVMGTTFSIDVYSANQGQVQAAIAQAFDEVHRLDRMLSNYIPDSELSRANEYAATKPVKVSRELFDLLATCIDYSRKSEGTFDITVGPLMKVWGFYKDSGHLPHRAEIRAALESVGYQNIELDASHLTVRLKKHGVNLDPGGVGKGYAVDKMAEILRNDGVTSALISGGGSSIYGIGAPPDDPRGWYIRVRDPKDEQRTAAEVYLKNDSISTSGNYEKFFWAEGKLYSHIMDPRTGYPSEGMLSVSIVSPKTLDSEIWAKPYYILGRAWTRQHKPKNFRVLMCEDKPGAACAWLK
ncbi:MAG TPA: FAD:protein FMN transferase [Bryobacteraceae bacterium]|nr:FAD:protein FMN transferase [Bryobacteraceae bacterium]